MCHSKEILPPLRPRVAEYIAKEEIISHQDIKTHNLKPKRPKHTASIHSNKSWIFKFLMTSSQSANVIAMVFVFLTCYVLVPDTARHSQSPSKVITVLYLLSYISHFGAQLWMTFISGITLYFGLPRHTFGKVQIILFPVYFLTTSILSLITLTTWLHHPQTNMLEFYKQTASIVLCFWVELVVLIYYAPGLVMTYSQKLGIEEQAGVGKEIGHYDPGSLKNCPHYCKVHLKFRRIHLITSLLNIVTIICNSYHFIHLAARLSDISKVS